MLFCLLRLGNDVDFGLNQLFLTRKIYLLIGKVLECCVLIQVIASGTPETVLFLVFYHRKM